jgi:hypothetical protein
MRTIFFDITPEHQIKGEGLLLKAFRGLKSGRYRCEIYSTNKRSLNQNSYLHVVFTLAQKGLHDLGYDWIRNMEDAKDFYKRMFLTIERPNVQTGEIYKVVRRTRDLSKDEMGEFIDKVREHQLEWAGVNIPTPDEYKQNYKRFDLVALAV